MADVSNLLQRIDAEFLDSEKKIKEFQERQTEAYLGRQERLELFQKACEKLRDSWQPRLIALAERFGDKVKVTPVITPTGRDVAFTFRSPLADIVLRFSVTTDFDVRNLVLDYDLHILPILMKFQPHVRAEFPLDAIDPAATERWIDDRIVDFVKTYLSLHQNEYYLKDHMVADPVCMTRFPKYAAGATLTWNGVDYYFVSNQTRDEFVKKNNIKP